MTIANAIAITSVKTYSGNATFNVRPKVVTRFTDADGNRYLHVSAPRYFDADGNACKRADAALVAGAAALVDGADVTVSANGTFHDSDGTGTIARLAR